MHDVQIVRAGWLIDGSGRPPLRHAELRIKDGQVVGIAGGGECGTSAGQPVIDLSHAVLCPPFIDCHVHLAFSGTTDLQTRRKLAESTFEEIRPVIRRHRDDLFRHGVTAARDAGDRRGHCLRYVEEQGPQDAAAVTVQASGIALHRQGRYGSMIGMSLTEGEDPADAWQSRGFSGSLLKLINSGPNSLREYGRETTPQFTVEEMRRLVAGAERASCRVMVHANGREPVRTAIEAGCHSIEHGYFMGRDNLQRMAEGGVFLVPTLFAMKACASQAASPSERKIAEKTLAHQLEQVALARELGVKVVLGTDSGSPGVLHGEAVVEEMKLLIAAGYPLAETVRCATADAAELLGLDRCRIAVGRPADFLVARGAPAQLPRKFSCLEAIWLAGRPSPLYRKNPTKGRASDAVAER